MDLLFKSLCKEQIAANPDRLLSNFFAKKFKSEVLYYLIKFDCEKIAIAHFDELDWEDHRDFFVNALAPVLEKYSSGYAVDILARAHHIDWAKLHPAFQKMLEQVLERALVHRNYEYEERIFGDRKLKNFLPEWVPTESFVPNFFRNKPLIFRLGKELNFSQTEVLLAQLDNGGQYWEEFQDKASEASVITDVHLYYAYYELINYSYHNGEGGLVPLLCRKLSESQARLQSHLPEPSARLRAFLSSHNIDDIHDVKILLQDWASLIGHIGHLNVHLMMREMNHWTGKPVLLTKRDWIANSYFLSLLSDRCLILVKDENCPSELWLELAGLVPFLGVPLQIFQYPDGRGMYWNDAGAIALKQWEDENRVNPLRETYDLQLTRDNSAAIALEALKVKWGMPKTAWHVCLHMRDAAMRAEQDGKGETIRNTTLENYLSAIKYITSLGGWVIRMGGNKAPPLPSMEQVVDYAVSEDTSPVMDVHLVRTSRILIGTTSGFSYVATGFDVPTAIVNAITSLGQIYPKSTRFALKPVRTIEGRMLTQLEMTSDTWRWAFPTHESLRRADLTVDENSADEILETVKETLVLAETNHPTSNSALIQKWRRNLSYPGYYGASQPSEYFLSKYGSEFLP
ncbi:MAG: TIGR04372 family glycosyltransferase [Cytophaga sp.]|nr:TIGR04372 family glycosyltransferase [Undibacterium sp.]